jgi:hypothetical protein
MQPNEGTGAKCAGIDRARAREKGDRDPSGCCKDVEGPNHSHGRIITAL